MVVHPGFPAAVPTGHALRSFTWKQPSSWVVAKQYPVSVPLVVVPVPFSGTVCGLPVRLSDTESVPVRLPKVLGANETLMGQLAADAKSAAQVLVSAKSPVAPMLAMFSVAVP